MKLVVCMRYQLRLNDFSPFFIILVNTLSNVFHLNYLHISCLIINSLKPKDADLHL